VGVASALACSIASAQVQDARSSTSTPIEEIVVRGQRLGQQRSIDRKREAAGFIDAVSSDDIGRLPDRNVAEALDRLAGVSLTVDQGEGRFVAIRGLSSSLNGFTINGTSAGTPEMEGGGRRVPLDVVGSGLVDAVEVVKVPTPDMEGQGVGGTINLITAGPFDHGHGPYTRLSARAGYDELNGERPYGGEFIIARVDAGGTWGWLLGVAHSYRRSEASGIYQEEWSLATTDLGATSVLPESTTNVLYDLERLRTGMNATFEWRPAVGQRYYIRGFFSRLEEDEIRRRFTYSFRNNPLSLTPTTGTSDANYRDVDLRSEQKDKRFLNVALGGEHTLASAWQLDYAAQVNDNHQEVPNRNWAWRGDDSGEASWSVDGMGLVEVSPGAVDPFDPATFAFLGSRTRDLATGERAYIAGFNLRRSLGSAASYVKVGAKYAATKRRNDATEIIHGPGAIEWTLAEFGHFGGVSTTDIDGRRRSIVEVDVRAANAFLNANRSSSDYFDVREAESFTAAFASDYNVDEVVAAGYAMANWDFGLGSIVAGLRAERTDIRSKGYQLDPERADASSATDKGNYSNVLPSLLARIELTPQLVLRSAWTHTLARPNYEQLAPISLLSREGDTGLLEIGNPDLKARESSNYDVALEWYFARDGLLAAAVFRKQIKNEIVSRFSVFDQFADNGELFEQLTINTTENAERAEANGFELTYQQQFDFLPAPFNGLGIALSYSAIESETRVAGRDDMLPLTRQPDWTRSCSLFYQNGGFELALAISEADSYLSEVSDAAQTDLYAGEYGRLDLRASYSITDRYRLFFEWQNSNQEPATERQGAVTRHSTQYEVYGQTWYLGLSVQL
jgi:TonB-dependent receptor